MKPLFIPLKTEFFEAFAAGTKTTEFRPYGPRWNERTCQVGREVVLSHGYGTKRRLRGVVTGFERSAEPTMTDAWRKCYGDRVGDAACIRVELTHNAELAGCTSTSDAQRALESAGYTEIQAGGYDVFACSKDDFYSTKFTAKNPAGQPVNGVVCSGLLFKSATIRF